MEQNYTKSELNTMLHEFSIFCKENAIPMFVATWDEFYSRNAGYQHKKVMPAQVGVDIKAYDVDDKFPLFVRIISGKEDTDEERYFQ